MPTLAVGVAGTGIPNIQNGGEVISEKGVSVGSASAGVGTLNINDSILLTSGLSVAVGSQADFDNPL